MRRHLASAQGKQKIQRRLNFRADAMTNRLFMINTQEKARYVCAREYRAITIH
jgi:hypothetical protein